MRLFLIFFLLLQSISFAQINPALNQLKPKKSKISRLELEYDSFDINKIDSNYKQFIDYDSINNLTEISYQEKTLKIGGKWERFNRNIYAFDVLVSHCPVFINEDNIILELGKFDNRTFKAITGIYTNDLTKVKAKITKPNVNFKVLSETYNASKNYYILKMLTASIVKEGELITYYKLIGIKNNYTYIISLQNFNESLYENLEEFVVSVYDMN